jgi:hypothetical protein
MISVEVSDEWGRDTMTTRKPGGRTGGKSMERKASDRTSRTEVTDSRNADSPARGADHYKSIEREYFANWASKERPGKGNGGRGA